MYLDGGEAAGVQDTRPSHWSDGGTADATEHLCMDRVLRARKSKKHVFGCGT